MIDDFMHQLRCRLAFMLDERRPADGVLGLPAVFALVLLGFMYVNSRHDSGGQYLDKLEKSAQQNIEKGKFVEAHITAMRLAQTDGQNQKAAILEAKALRGMHREKEAARLLARVAPMDAPGHAPAHVMQAALLLAKEVPDVQAALRHVENALHTDPDNQDALELAARFAAAKHDWKACLAHLNNLQMDNRADLLLMKATALQFCGLEDESIKCAHHAEDTLRAMQGSLSSGQDRIRLSIAVSLSLQRRFDQAIKWLVETAPERPDKEERQVLGGIYFSWSRHLHAQSPARKLEALELLEKGIEISPESQDIIMAFLHDCDEITTDVVERRHLVERVLCREGISQSFLHYYLGQQEWQLGHKEAARSHFELASTINPRFGIITNNLAMAIASVSSDHGELERALTMMDQLLRQEPQNAFFLDTRGHILIKLGRFHEAARDLARALPNAQDKISANTTLAALYRELGMPELATEHQSLVTQLTASSPISK